MKTEKLKGASTMKESKYAGTQTEKNLMAAFAGDLDFDWFEIGHSEHYIKYRKSVLLKGWVCGIVI